MKSLMSLTRIQESEERSWFSTAKNMDEKLVCQGEAGRAAGAIIFDGCASVHQGQYHPYDMLDLVLYGATMQRQFSQAPHGATYSTATA